MDLEGDVQLILEAEKVVGRKLKNNQVFYLIKWKHFDERRMSWIAENHVSPRLVEDFYKVNEALDVREYLKRISMPAQVVYEISVVEHILDKEEVDGKTFYQVKWQDYGEDDNSWVPEESMHCIALLNAFNEKWAANQNIFPPEMRGNIYEVEMILAKERKNGKDYYLIKWKDYGTDAICWEPEENLDCPGLVEAFNFNSIQLKKLFC